MDCEKLCGIGIFDIDYDCVYGGKFRLWLLMLVCSGVCWGRIEM